MNDCPSLTSVEDIYDLTADDSNLLAYLQVKNLLPSSYKCDKCNNFCKIVLSTKNNSSGYFNFVCEKTINGKKHYFCRSLNKNSFFANARITYKQVLIIIYNYIFFENICLVPQLSITADVHSEALGDWTNYIREVCINSLSLNKIGGKDKVVEIDESLFGKRKYHRGRINKGQYWVFGGVEQGTNNCFLVPVPKRDSATLLPIILNNILPGTTIISDCWKAYDCLANEGYQHLKVNHTYNFVDPDTGAHTNTIEGLWSHAKASDRKSVV
jgi:transposase-like protein